MTEATGAAEAGQAVGAGEDVEAAYDRAASLLRDATDVALACHVNPDPDALGSMLGLSEFLRERGARTVCSFGNEPFEPPRWAHALPGAGALVAPREFPRAPALMVTTDSASLDRLGNLAPSASKADELIWIDHHTSNPGLGTVRLIDPTASSTAEMAYRLMKRIGGEVSGGVAAALYAGIVTDTGRFQYSAAGPETLRLTAELRERAFDHVKLAQALFEDSSVGYLRLLAVALARVRLEQEASLVWTYLTQADLDAAGVAAAETDDLIDVIRTAREADVAAVIKQQRDGRFKASLRSRGGSDLAAVAARFGGGGHRLAAGFTSKVGMERTVRDLVGALLEQRQAADP